jgi:phospholipase C
MRSGLLRAAFCVAALAGFGGSGTTAAAPPPTGSDAPTPATLGTGQQIPGSKIAHVIVMIQENRTVDNLFSSSFLSGGDGYPGANTTRSALLHTGKTAPLAETPFEVPYTPLHAHKHLVNEWNKGAMNQFDLDPAEPTQPGYHPPPMAALGYVPDFESLLYHALAYRYALADMTFSSRLAPTFPGHQWLIAGQGPADDPVFPSLEPTPNQNIWGCDSAPGTTAAAFTTGESTTPGPVCFNYPTIADLMDAHHVTWRYYTGAIGTYDGSISAFDAVQHVRSGPDWTKNVVSPPTAILGDIASCNLPSVSYVTPPEAASDLSGTLGAGGPAWAATIYIALTDALQQQKSANCRYYDNTAIILTWDDSGGWYDHVPPPPSTNGAVLGFRVPLLVISGYAKSNYVPGGPYLPFVSHVTRSHASILAYIEKNYALGSLGQLDATADPLDDMFDNARTSPVTPIPNSIVQGWMRKALVRGEQLPWTQGVVDRD